MVVNSIKKPYLGQLNSSVSIFESQERRNYADDDDDEHCDTLVNGMIGSIIMIRLCS